MTSSNLQADLDAAQGAFRALGRALDALSSSMGMAEVFDVIRDSVLLLGYSHATVRLLDESGGMLTVRVKHPRFILRDLIMKFTGTPLAALDIPITETENISVKAMMDGRTYVTNSLYDALRPMASKEVCDQVQAITGYKVSVAVPLRVKGKSEGVLIVHSDAVDYLSQPQLELLHLFANQAAWAIEKERLYDLALDMSLTDPLTNLPNRRHFMEQLQHTIAASKRSGSPFSILFVDVDDLKDVNDRHGHQAGDELLKGVGSSLKSSLREYDIVSRYGGDEFAILLHGLDAGGSVEVAKRAQAAAHSCAVSVGNDVFIKGQVSIGIATYPEHGSEASELLDNADTAMYAAKHAGRGAIRAFESEKERKKS